MPSSLWGGQWNHVVTGQHVVPVHDAMVADVKTTNKWVPTPPHVSIGQTCLLVNLQVPGLLLQAAELDC
jgi:hypothetical protein